MIAHRLLEEPLWRAEDLGKPIPGCQHAVSVALPRWQDVVDYEEHKPEVIDRLEGGYPRFVVPRLVRQLARHIEPDLFCLPFPSESVARQAAAFVKRQTGGICRFKEKSGVVGVITSPEGAAALQSFWQHTGWIVSSRRAEACLENAGPNTAGAAYRQELTERLAGFYDCAPDDVFLTPTGMAAHSLAWQVVSERRPNAATAQLGFPYVDTLKLQQKIGHGATLLHCLDTIEADLTSLMTRQALAACFCEIPGNPLLGSADIRQVTPILRSRGVPLVVDDVVATPVNLDLRAHADLVVTSLTKFIAGTCDVMGGAVVCNPSSPYAAELKAGLRRFHEELLWDGDAAVLALQARVFPERMEQHNRNGLIIAERLRAHPQVEAVWYPKWCFNEAYESVRRPDGGWGALITFLPRHAPSRAPRVFDRLRVTKGPSLGTIFTIACPFTLLAHYCELEWAESCGVSRYLIRLSIGLEDPEDMWRRICQALEN
ncbi:MAG TPA: PLP-dependent transferase [Candidatus Paceibacterota bacterium]|nr:PLP-dependent transferase [Verrucomicrobiota bacterium]HRY49852.1 PLP-dependent transferase [Candidatus Paceibacterota bacterium]